MNFEEFEQALRKAISYAVEAGFEISAGVTVEGDKCCPIGALKVEGCGLLPNNTAFYDYITIARGFGLTIDQARVFAHAFDDAPYRYRIANEDEPFRALGVKMRKEFIA